MSKPVTVLTGEEWAQRVREAAEIADKLIADLIAVSNGPGEAVLASMLIARALCVGIPQLPDFAWYSARVAELPIQTLVSTMRELAKGKN